MEFRVKKIKNGFITDYGISGVRFFELVEKFSAEKEEIIKEFEVALDKQIKEWSS